MSFSLRLVSDRSTASGHRQRPHEVAEIVRERVKLKPHGVGGKRATRQPRPLDRCLALLDPLLRSAALIVEGHHVLGRFPHVGDDEPDARIKLARVPLDFGDHPAWLRPASSLIAEIGMEPTLEPFRQARPVWDRAACSRRTARLTFRA